MHRNKNNFSVGDYVVLTHIPTYKNNFNGYDSLEIGKIYRIEYISSNLVSISLDVEGIKNFTFYSGNFISLMEYRESKLELLLG